MLPYLNVSILVHYLSEMDTDAELLVCPPSQSYAHLIKERVDAAILPVVDYFNSEGLQIVDSLGICAQGPVESVLLCCQKPLNEIQTIRLDPASKTSNALARILLKRHFQVQQIIRYDTEIEHPDAEIIIADRALTSKYEGVCYDMAHEWHKMTGFGFVFAVWACRKDHPDYAQISSVLRKSKEKGQGNISYLSKRYAKTLQLEEDFCEQYITKRIIYDIGPLEAKGMELFRQFYCQMSAELK